jgi:hypothetical protein
MHVDMLAGEHGWCVFAGARTCAEELGVSGDWLN